MHMNKPPIDFWQEFKKFNGDWKDTNFSFLCIYIYIFSNLYSNDDVVKIKLEATVSV